MLPNFDSPGAWLRPYHAITGTLPARAATTTIAIASAVSPSTATAGSAAATTAARTSTASATVSAFRAWPRLVHGDSASTQIASVQSFDGGSALRAVSHFYEPETAQASAELIANEVHLADRSILSKSLSQIVFTGTKGEISHVDIQSVATVLSGILAECWALKHQTTIAALEAGFLSAGSSVELGRSKCTTVGAFPASRRKLAMRGNAILTIEAAQTALGA